MHLQYFMIFLCVSLEAGETVESIGQSGGELDGFGHRGNHLRRCFRQIFFFFFECRRLLKALLLFSFMPSHRHTDVSPGEIRLWGLHQQVCVVVMEMRRGEGLRERRRRGGLRIR